MNGLPTSAHSSTLPRTTRQLPRTSRRRTSPTRSIRSRSIRRPFAQALEAAEGDRWFFEDASRTAIFYEHLRETWRQGLDAIKWELVDAFQPWGFRLADISVPVTIFHGGQDPWVAQEYIDFQVNTIPNSTLVVWPDGGHLGFVKHWSEVLDAVA